MVTHETVTHETTDDVLARIHAQAQAATEQMLRAQEFQAAVAAVRGRGSTPGVEAEVDAGGVLRGLRFTTTASPPGDALVRAVMSALRAAQTDALRQVESHTERVWGSNDPLAARIVAEAAERLGLADVFVGRAR